MFSRSRSISLLLMLFAAVTLFGPVGCASTKPREKWWQFWRPKKIAATSLHHPDRVILPPPPGELAGGPGSESLDAPGNLPPPPTPFDVAMDTPEGEPIRTGPGDPVADLQTVYFAFDSYELDDAAKAALDSNIAWLQSRPGIEIQIEGHCDERGTLEYNLLLGERRAKAVKAYLMQRGVSGEVLHTISYGEERPLDPTGSDVAFSKNRRAQFLVY